MRPITVLAKSVDRAMVSGMSETASTIEVLETRKKVTLNIKAEAARKGRALKDVIEAAGISHSASIRRTTGATGWRFADLIAIATVLEIDPNRLLPDEALTWELALALE